MRGNCTPKSLIKVSGEMSEHDAGITAKMYAAAAVIAATLAGLAALIAAIRWW